ncbi:MAG: cell wall metabolism sensor histidine kinase WalK [Pseudobutyrivibrio sp.]|nr:cell wall metabolism sensor histidine kinase WalK [Pseudobutyrivibrio sp.]
MENKSKKFSFIRSLGFKSALVILVVGIIPFLVCVPISMRAYETVTIDNDASNIIVQALQYNSEIITSGYIAGEDNRNLETKLQSVAEAYQGRILVIDSSLKVISDSFQADEGKTVVWENVIRAVKGETLSYYDDDALYLIVTVPLTNSEGDIVGAIVINKGMDYMLQNEDKFISYYLIIMVALLSFVIFVAVVYSHRCIGPLRKVSEDLDSISREYTNELPERVSYTELESIEEQFNQVLSKLHSIDESRQEFVSNVSHELKTPLTSMKVLADSLNGSEDVPLEMYKEFMSDIGDEIDRETKIINDLLSLVRMDKTGAALNISAVNINELIEHILKRLSPIAEKSDIEVVFESFRPVVAEVDEVKFTLVVTNLVENAIKYNNPDGWVHITLNSDHQFCYIKVEDNGLGIPEESVEHIFERFYRADKSHSREIGGTGLGLAITKSAIAMHNGEIKVHSKLGEGTTFDVRIPLNYIKKEGE